MSDDLVKLVPLRTLARWSPFRVRVWGDFKRTIRVKEVTQAIQEGRLNPKPYSEDGRPWRRQDHIQRIAHLVVHPSPHPIGIDVGVPALGFCPEWPIYDGNHRLGSAFYRRLDHILIDFSGDIAIGEKLFGLSFSGPARN